ncbi:hypothetical protein [Candidatus Protochlamydia sp. R18]|uniref:hypothetical protein n=1 Tax=Candidatus Protochlamydia sp. R18 TaxID=1353977 RepID=UPI0005A65F97|nr:hypothetical protein [Candidatus Protochlamydia sp. R18]
MIIDFCLNFLNSSIEFHKEIQTNENGSSQCSPAAADAAAQKYLKKLGATPETFSKWEILEDMFLQTPIYFSFSLYKFYFYQSTEIANSKNFDNELAIQLDKTKQIAEKAIQEYLACMKLVEKSFIRETFNFIPGWIWTSVYGNEFVSIPKIKLDSSPTPEEYTDYLINECPKATQKNFRSVIEKMRNIGLPTNIWGIFEFESQKYIEISPEIFAKVHHRAVKDLSHLFNQYADDYYLDKNLMDKNFKKQEVFQIPQQRVEVYEQQLN